LIAAIVPQELVQMSIYEYLCLLIIYIYKYLYLRISISRNYITPEQQRMVQISSWIIYTIIRVWYVKIYDADFACSLQSLHAEPAGSCTGCRFWWKFFMQSLLVACCRRHVAACCRVTWILHWGVRRRLTENSASYICSQKPTYRDAINFLSGRYVPPLLAGDYCSCSEFSSNSHETFHSISMRWK